MSDNKLLVADQHSKIAEALGIDESFVRQVALRLKSDGRIPATKPVASQYTPQSLATLLFGLCAPIPSRSLDMERKLGALPRQSGDGSSTADIEIEFLISEAARLMEGQVDFRHGELLIGIDRPTVCIVLTKFDGSETVRTYQAGKSGEAMTRWVRIPLPTLRKLAQELINE